MISLIHPSRGRPKKSFENSKEWIDKAGCQVELIVSLDSDDCINEYSYWYQTIDSYRMFNNNKSVVEATNVACKKSTGDILIYLSDDFKCFDGWGLLVQKEFEGITEPMLIKVDDCLQQFNVAVLTIPIMNRALYEKLGYFWHPEYKSMFVDEDLYWTSKNLNALKECPHLKFEHQHTCMGKAENDDTYQRSAANWDQGKAVFARRKLEGFPI